MPLDHALPERRRYRGSVARTDSPPDRHVLLDACFNVRDLGGYPAADGRSVRWGEVFRGDGLHRLTPAGAQPLHDLAIRTVLDLRTSGERDEVGSFTAQGIEVVHLPVLQEIWDREL